EFGSIRPRSVAGDDYRERYNQLSVGVGFTPGWRTTVDVSYLFRYENYPEPNSAADFRTSRQDTVSQFSVSVQRPITTYVSVALAYYGTVDDSNIPVYQSHRSIVAAEVLSAYWHEVPAPRRAPGALARGGRGGRRPGAGTRRHSHRSRGTG